MLTKLLLSIVFLGTASLAGCGGPFVMLPGGPLEGSMTGVPGSWEFTEDVDTVQLETRPPDPYSVNIWVTALGGNLYLHAGANRSAWVENIERDPNVRLKVGDSIYELVASRVVAQDEFDRFSEAYETKYGYRPRNESVVEAYLFRLVARDANGLPGGR